MFSIEEFFQNPAGSAGVHENAHPEQRPKNQSGATSRQEEFFFSVPYPVMDLCLYGLEHGIAAVR